jgi:hypothetical protein
MRKVDGEGHRKGGRSYLLLLELELEGLDSREHANIERGRNTKSEESGTKADEFWAVMRIWVTFCEDFGIASPNGVCCVSFRRARSRGAFPRLCDQRVGF